MFKNKVKIHSVHIESKRNLGPSPKVIQTYKKGGALTEEGEHNRK